MKLVIVAAGQGTRLRPLTDKVPKCMVPFRGKPIVDHLLDTAHVCGIQEIAIVHGYKAEVLEDHLRQREVRFFHNAEFASTNMVTSLFCAEEFLTSDVIISYGDIVYQPAILQRLCQETAEVALTIDTHWESLWKLRMENPLQDAETLKLGPEGNILELGKKPKTLADIQGQYMGLIKWSGSALPSIRGFYRSLDPQAIFDGKDFANMYMTSFLQRMIDHLMPVKAVPVQGGWVEIDSLADLKAYQDHAAILGI